MSQHTRLQTSMQTTRIKNPLIVAARVIAYSVSLLAIGVSSAVMAATDVWVANGDGTVTDVATGLIWQQQDDDIRRNHANAISFCQNLSLAGQSDWRLPNIKELTSLVDYRQTTPSIDADAFPNTNSAYTSAFYWSASSRASSSSSAWDVHFFLGNVSSVDKTNVNFVRCVR